MKKNIKIIIISTLIVLWMIRIFVFSSANGTESQSQSTNAIASIISITLKITNKLTLTDEHPSEERIYQAAEVLDGPARKLMHQAEYFILALLVMILANILLNYNKYVLSFIITLVICIVFAGFDEFHQTFISGRTGQLKDVIVDTTGMIYAIIIYSTYYYTYKKGKKDELIKNKKE